MRILHFLIVAVFFLSMFSCKRSEQSDGGEEEKMRLCKEILATAEKDQVPKVQPPALELIPIEGGGFPRYPVPADSHVVVGFNLGAFQKAGLIDHFTRRVPGFSTAISALMFLGISPGRTVQSAVAGVRFGGTEWIPERGVVAFSGTFQANSAIERIFNISGKLPNASLPPLTRDGADLVISGLGREMRMSQKDGHLLVSTEKGTAADLSDHGKFKMMMEQIPPETAIWFAGLSLPEKLPRMPRVFARLVSNLQMFSGYFNFDAQQNSEFQIRMMFATPEDARQAKEVIRLGLSQGLNMVGPRIQKAFLLDGTSDFESVVSRGRMVRILFRMDRHQTQYLMDWMTKSARTSGLFQLPRNSAMNAASGSAEPPAQADEPAEETENM